jgi:hypothetical protein
MTPGVSCAWAVTLVPTTSAYNRSHRLCHPERSAAGAQSKGQRSMARTRLRFDKLSVTRVVVLGLVQLISPAWRWKKTVGRLLNSVRLNSR